jgi:hypothetical protein
MRRIAVLVVGVAVIGAICTAAMVTIRAEQHDVSRLEAQNPRMGGIHWARGQAPAARPNKSPNLIYHGGPVMNSGAYVEPIYWGARWGNAAFVADKRDGLKNFYSSIGGSSYADTNTEYTDSVGAVSSSVSWGGDHIDLSQAPASGQQTSPILAEVCRVATNLVSDGYYPVYVDSPRGHSRFCAWHSAGTCPTGQTVQFAFFYNLDGDAGCDPEDTSGLHSQGLAALANVSGHELSEALTDPHLNAWYDANGAENSDKCAWTFGTPLLSFSRKSAWKIQGNWSNRAFNTGTGYPNSGGLLGCIDGGNFPTGNGRP